jgi:hypothetical protein
MSEATKEEMLFHLDCAWSGNNYKAPCDTTVCVEYKNGRCRKSREAIRRFIEQGKPKVSRAWIDEKIQYLSKHPSHHRLEMVLLEAGVEVEE